MQQWAGKIHNGDALLKMKDLPDESVGLVLTSPPYNMRNTTGGGLLRGGVVVLAKAEKFKMAMMNAPIICRMMNTPNGRRNV